MKTFIQTGDTLTLVAPYDVLSGGGALVGSIFGVASDDVLSGVAGEFVVDDAVVNFAKTSALAIAVGDLLYWDDTNKVVNKTDTNKLVGVAAGAAANPSATVKMRLNGSFIS